MPTSAPAAPQPIPFHPSGWSQQTMATNPLSTLLQRFAYARLSQPCLPDHGPAFPQRSPPSLLTTAACGGLRSAPDCRPRRALLHLPYSCATPCGRAMLVTQDPLTSYSPSSPPTPHDMTAPYKARERNPCRSAPLFTNG